MLLVKINSNFTKETLLQVEQLLHIHYKESLASFTTGELYDHHDADGFITLFGLPLKVRAMKMLELEKNKTNQE